MIIVLTLIKFIETSCTGRRRIEAPGIGREKKKKKKKKKNQEQQNKGETPQFRNHTPNDFVPIQHQQLPKTHTTHELYETKKQRIQRFCLCIVISAFRSD
jgi:hypothetical protein